MAPHRIMAHNNYHSVPPWDYEKILNDFNPRKGLCYFIERKSDKLWLHKSTECFTNNEKEALCYSGEKGKEHAERYLQTIKAWVPDECVVIEYEIPELQK